MNTDNCCCPRFNPEPWEDKEIKWKNKLFTQDYIRSFFHIPLNFGQVITRMIKKIEASDVKCEDVIAITDECSLWGTNVFINVTGDVENGKMTTISGTFLTKVFEGPYKNMGKWIQEMKQYVEAQGQTITKQYYYYTTCPKCAKKYEKNYVVLIAKID